MFSIRQRARSQHSRSAPVLQVLTSDTTATGAALLCWLRARWRIENMFKYASAHNGIDTLADYLMDIGPDTRTVTNPARVAARKTVTEAQAALVPAERALPQLLARPGTPAQMNAALPAVHRRIEAAAGALERAKMALRAVPAKVAATELDPNAKRARPRLQRRGLQMVLRLLAFNAEAWLAEHFNVTGVQLCCAHLMRDLQAVGLQGQPRRLPQRSKYLTGARRKEQPAEGRLLLSAQFLHSFG